MAILICMLMVSLSKTAAGGETRAFLFIMEAGNEGPPLSQIAGSLPTFRSAASGDPTAIVFSERSWKWAKANIAQCGVICNIPATASWWPKQDSVRHRLQPQPRRLHPLRQLPPARLLRRPRRLHLHFAVKQCQYKVLGLGGDCTADEICSAYRRLAFQHHPDKLAQFGISPAAYRRPALQAYQTSPFP
ncbi:hypothetical protein RJ640_013214 [Escallonia rubra]|uniref:J domain-containing protein n=1 Tax=Escallonia rubra TaxID=112253 RepID=A0AA88UEK9_9ASTE|nr:hypothetical protein RJ640_013214 [Escallonia rubra]